MLQFYALFDKKTAGYLTPQPYKHVQEAIRAVTGLLESGKGGDFARYHGDFALYFVGTFDQMEGTFLKDEKSSFVVELSTLMPIPGKEVLHA